MDEVNVHEAKTHLSRLLDRVEQGESIVIARNSRPVAKLVPLKRADRTPGRLRGRLRVDDNFDDPLPPDVIDVFTGRK